MLVDSHCHLNYKQIYSNLDYFIKLMVENNVSHALTVSTEIETIKDVVEISETYNNIFSSIGIHPDEIECDYNSAENILNKYANNLNVVAIGETGLDYYRNPSIDSIKIQKKFFNLQINKSIEFNLPLIIHTRNSSDDTYEILNYYKEKNINGVMHCFTESICNAKKFLDLGFYISISGIVTFKNANEIRELAKFVPQDRLLIETDSPFLAPEPSRGKENHPALLKHTALRIAEIRNISLEELGKLTSENFFRLFKRAKK